MVVVEIEEVVGKVIEREAHLVKAIGQFLENIGQFAAARGRVRGDELEIGPADFFVELQVGRAPPAAVLGVFVKDSAHEERVVADMGAEQKTLLGIGAGQRDQHIGEILLAGILFGVRRAQAIGAREGLEKRPDIIRELAIGDVGPLQDMPGQDVEVKGGGDREMPGVGQNRLDQARMIEHSVARLGVTEEVDERNLIVRRAGQRAHDKLEIRRGEPRSTIRLDHREHIISVLHARGQGL